jgi:hypothetical protein
VPAASLPASAASATMFQLIKALPSTRQGPSLQWEGGKKASPLGGEGSLHRKDPRPSWDEEAYKRRNLPLLGGRSVREKARDVSRESKRPGTWQKRIPSGDLLSPPGTCMEDARRKSTTADLQKDHYHDRRGNDRQGRLVESHWCSVLGGVKDNTVRSPAGLCYCPKSRDICHACNLASVVSP